MLLTPSANLTQHARQSLGPLEDAQRHAHGDLVALRMAVPVPKQAFDLLVEVVTRLAEGDAVELVTHTAEVSTQEAADMLRVSRPTLVGLLERGSIPHRKVGSHRRVLMADVLAYKERCFPA